VALLDFLRLRCPSCNKRGLRIAQAIRASTAHYTFYACPTCAGRFRQDGGTAIRPATDDEWRKFVTNPKPPPKLA
jgi:hypothetical protein